MSAVATSGDFGELSPVVRPEPEAVTYPESGGRQLVSLSPARSSAWPSWKGIVVDMIVKKSSGTDRVLSKGSPLKHHRALKAVYTQPPQKSEVAGSASHRVIDRSVFETMCLAPVCMFVQLHYLRCWNKLSMASPLSPYPLSSTSATHLQILCEELWGWEICSGCKLNLGCSTSSSSCPWPRSERLSVFFGYYKLITSSYVPELLHGKPIALRTHDDVVDIIRHIKRHPNVPRQDLTRSYFSARDGEEILPPEVDRNRAFNLAVAIMAMVNCSTSKQSSGFLELGSEAIPWREDVPFSKFIDDAFPKTNHPSLNDSQTSTTRKLKAALAAKRLRRVAGLKFQATNDLRNHLLLDQEAGILLIFHQTPVLKENLVSTRSKAKSSSLDDSIRL